ncbi:hypothetical protein [Zavarzinia sp.]|uniref:hypothetical protein n=1 Tax=Zavarzinia sp. TaxID=2027920 RepID=UPI003BB5EA24|nr:hypothetical protein [Zavarzinia sp.]
MAEILKVTLDLDQLVAAGELTPAEAERLSLLGRQTTSMLAFNILVGFGVLAVATGALALVPQPGTAVVIGLVIAAAGFGIARGGLADWGLLAQLCIITGSLIAGGGALTAGDFSVSAFLIVALVYAIGAGVAGNGLLAALAVIAVSGAVGAQAGYLGEGGYGLAVPDSSLAILVMVALAAILVGLARVLGPAAGRLPRVGAGTAVIVANFGFWVGSLWGDTIDLGGTEPLVVPELAFTIAWALVLLVAGIRAGLSGARWILNCAAIFAAIHLYTQWFERLDTTPESMLAAGILALVLALGLAALNKRLST